MVQKIRNNNMDEVLRQPFAVADFSAEWCGPCRMLAPVLEELSEEKSGEAAFYSIDTDENPQLAQEYDIQSIPSLLAFKNGEPVASTVGFLPKQSLADWIDSLK